MTPLGTALIAAGAVTTTVSDVAGVVLAGIGLAWETFLFWRAGRS